MANRAIDPKTLQNVIRRGVSEIIVEEEFVRLLQEGAPLRLKMGFDPSRPDIHLGHAVGLRKLRQLQDLGHQVILIVGDWTAQIGDPSGQSVTRPMLTVEEVRDNAESYMRHFFKVVDRERTQTVWQSEWFGQFTLANVFDLTRRFTVAQFLARDDFAQRFKAQRPIAITELLYPLLQAYDSVVVQSRRGIRRHRPEVQPAGGSGPPGNDGADSTAVLHRADPGRDGRGAEDEQEP